jgi:regulator of protease activity HflC (stomatin/prohibitin superfamily)
VPIALRARARSIDRMLLDSAQPAAANRRTEPALAPPWPLRRLPPHRARYAAIATIVVLIGGIVVALTGAKFVRQDAGHVGVVRNGGPLDNRAIRQILMPGQKITWSGVYSQAPREYPASRVVLLYTVTSDQRRGERPEVDVVSAPTKDGVLVGLEGTIFFRFVGERDLGLLRRFDQTFGMRTYPVPGGKGRLHAWEGDEGFAAMLDAAFRPVLDNDLRKEVGRFECADLVASCALVHRIGDARRVTRAEANANIAAIEDRLTRSLAEDLRTTLGSAYFWDMRVRLVRVTLPGLVQGAIDDVHAKYVSVNGARADVKRARFEARRNELLSRAYNRSPALAQIDAIKSAPKGATIVLSSADKKSPGINVGGG